MNDEAELFEAIERAVDAVWEMVVCGRRHGITAAEMLRRVERAIFSHIVKNMALAEAAREGHQTETEQSRP